MESVLWECLRQRYGGPSQAEGKRLRHGEGVGRKVYDARTLLRSRGGRAVFDHREAGGLSVRWSCDPRAEGDEAMLASIGSVR